MRTRIQRVSLAVVAIWLLSHAVSGTPVVRSQSCRVYGLEWNGNPLGELVTITVLMNDTSTSGLHLGAGITIAQAESSLRHAISIWNEDAGANFRLVYGGRTTATSVPGQIVVTGNDTTWFPDTHIAFTTLQGDDPPGGYLDYATIQVNRRKLDGSFRTFTLSTDYNVTEPWDFVGIRTCPPSLRHS